MPDQDKLDQTELARDGEIEEESSAEQEYTNFQLACDFVDDAIDAVDRISDLSIEALIVLTVLRIVRHPEDFKVNITRASRMVVIELDVHEDDLGPVIGRYGHTVDSLRDIARSAAGDSGVDYDIVPLENGKPPPSRNRRYSRNRDLRSGRQKRSYRRSH